MKVFELFTVLLVTVLNTRVQCYPSGAPIGQCVDMQPSVNVHLSEQTTESPYSIKVSKNTTQAGEDLYVEIDGDSLKGILLEAREADSTNIIGTLSEVAEDFNYNRFKSLECNGPNSAITHYNGDTKQPPFVFLWEAPVTTSGYIEFVATIVKTKTEYWRSIKSEPVYVESLGNCTHSDYHLYEECFQYIFLDGLSDGIYNPDGVCSYIQDTWDLASECFHSYNQLCVDAGEKADQIIAASVANTYQDFQELKVEGYADYCDECGYVEVNGCLYPLTILDLSDTQNTCSEYHVAEECLTNLQQTCGTQNRSLLLTSIPADMEAVNASLQANLYQCQQYENCTTVNEKIQQLESCVIYELPDPFSFDSVCELVESYTNCLLQAVDGCLLLDEILTSHKSVMRTLSSAFSCTTTNFNPLDNDCNLRQLLECYNPVLEHLSVFPLNSTSNIDSHFTTLSSLSFENLQEMDRQLICRNTEDLLQNATDCFVNKSAYCPFNPLSEELDVSVPTEEIPSAALQPIIAISSDVNFTLFGDIVAKLKELTTQTHDLSQTLDFWCEEGCTNTEEREASFEICIQDTGDISVAVTNVLESYNNGVFTSGEDCQPVIQYTNCVDEHLSGCGLTESSIDTNDVRASQAISICDVRNELNYREQRECLDEAYRNHQLNRIQESCLDITSEEYRTSSNEELCLLLQERSSCFVDNSVCCGLKKFTVEPRFLTWSIIHQWLGCDSVLNDTFYITALPDQCNLKDIFDCYGPLLDLVDFEYYTTRKRLLLLQISSVREYFLDPVKRIDCPPQDVFLSMESCVQEKTVTCSFPPACLHQDVAIVTDPMPLPLADLLGFRVNQELCSSDCTGRDFSLNSLSECELEHIPQYTKDITWKDVTGSDFQNDCRSLQDAMTCIEDKIGSCSPVRSFIRAYLHRYPWHQAMSLCALDTLILDPEAYQWEVLEESTTPSSTTSGNGPSVISEATPDVQITRWCYYLTAIQLMMWTSDLY